MSEIAASKKQRKESPEDERIHKCPYGEKLLTTYDESIATILDIFENSYKKFGQNEFLGSRESETSPYKWITYQEVKETACAVASGLITLGIKPKALVGMCAGNKPTWTIVEHGLSRNSMVSVPLYETLGKEGIRHIMGQTELEVIFCDGNKVEKLLAHGGHLGHLKWMIVFTEPDESAIAKVKEAGIKLIKFQDLVESGKNNPQPESHPTPTDLVCICYTSGTTGNPKGVMISHGANLAGVTSLRCLSDNGGGIYEDDCVISFLPLAHVYERMCEMGITSVGGKIGYFRGDMTKLLADIQELKPTLFPMVPRLLNSLYDRIMLSVSNSWVKSYLLNWGLSSKTYLLEKGVYTRNTWWDTLIFQKVQNNIGGRVRLAVTGSAPLSGAVLQFAKCALGCPILEAYAQTETGGLGTCCSADDNSPGHVGKPVRTTQIKLVDVPDLGYFAKDDKGEICMRGTSLFSGYYNDPEKTKEALDEDGWLHSGDIGQWLPSGNLKIIDRKKHIFKLSQGEYVAPEKIEQVYIKSPYVTNIFVTGDSLKNFVVAIVVPDKDALQQWANKNNAKNSSFEELCKREDVKALVFDSLMHLAMEEKLCSFEQPKIIHLDHEEFSIDNGLLTPTMKNRRPQIKKKYLAVVEAMYKKQASKPTRISVF